MDCLDENTAAAYVSSTLSPSERAGVDGHVADCDECRMFLSAVANLPAPDEADTIVTDHEAEAADVASRTLAPGTPLGRYVIGQAIGAGGMGIVYRARDVELDRSVALKILRQQEGDDRTERRTRLLREAQALARLSHPNVTAVYDVGSLDEQVFVALELVEGVTLSAWLKAAPRGTGEILGHFVAAGEGLCAAHSAGLVHRDFKPSNVLVGTDGRVRVTDFGLARRVVHEDGQRGATSNPSEASLRNGPLTQTGTIMGTPGYMSPEQLRGQATDARCDQFSFCVSLYEALAGARPFSIAQLEQIARGANDVQPLDPPTHIAPALLAVLRRGLAIDPVQRYATLGELLAALRELRTLSLEAPPRITWRGAVSLALIVACAAIPALIVHWRSHEAARASSGGPAPPIPRAAGAVAPTTAADPAVVLAAPALPSGPVPARANAAPSRTVRRQRASGAQRPPDRLQPNGRINPFLSTGGPGQ